MSQLYPRIFDRPGNGLRLVAVCANGELHEIGMRMVADLFEMDGWETLYLGASTPIPAVVDQLLATPPHLLAISATIAPNVAAVAALVAAVRAEPALAAVSVMVGGTPFNQAPGLWRRLGADGTAPDARSALALARTMVTP
jgi:methanogenic corrinoid protein MtbC1